MTDSVSLTIEPLTLHLCLDCCQRKTLSPDRRCAACGAKEYVRAQKERRERREVIDMMHDAVKAFGSKPFLAVAGRIYGGKP